MKKVIYLAAVVVLALAACKKDKPSTPAEDILFQDNLTSNTNGWLVDSFSTVIRKFEGGHYEIIVDTPSVLFNAVAPYTITGVPYSVQADLTINLQNSDEEGSAGLLFNNVNSSNHYYVEIWNTGYYYIEQKVNGVYSLVVANTFSSAINNGQGKKNTVKVIQNQSNMELVINNTSVGIFNISLPTTSFTTGIEVGAANTYFTPNTVQVNNFKIIKNQ